MRYAGVVACRGAVKHVSAAPPVGTLHADAAGYVVS